MNGYGCAVRGKVFERDEKGNVTSIVVVVQDITATKKEKKKLRSSIIFKTSRRTCQNRKLGIQYQNKRISMERWHVCFI